MNNEQRIIMSNSAFNKVTVLPQDVHNRKLVDYVHPPNWVNPQPADRYDLVVIGAGTAGLVVAAGAAGLGLGLKIALIEKHLMGGDCLNVGCVPSKCVIRSSRVIGEIREAAMLGVRVGDCVEVDFPAVMERMRRLRAGISHHDSAERFKKLGIVEDRSVPNWLKLLVVWVARLYCSIEVRIS
jgi:Pyridine nucleotide-disulphide oxidoreductase